MKHLLPLLQHLQKTPKIEEGEPLERTRFNFGLWIHENIAGTNPRILAKWLQDYGLKASKDDKLSCLFNRVRTFVMDDLGIITTDDGYVLLDDDVIKEVYDMAHSAAKTDDLGIDDKPTRRKVRIKSTRVRKPVAKKTAAKKPVATKKATAAAKRATAVKKTTAKKTTAVKKTTAKKTTAAAKKPETTNGSGRRGRPVIPITDQIKIGNREPRSREGSYVAEMLEALGTFGRKKVTGEMLAECLVDEYGWTGGKARSYIRNGIESGVLTTS